MMSKNYAAVNPCVMCMPMGSVMAFRGIEKTMPLFHGSQGCSTYMRLHLAHHFREPIDIAASAMSEKGAVYGGASHLKKAFKNVIRGYDPRIIGVATTCLAETIGENVPRIIREFHAEEPAADDITIIPVSTPSYARSHEDGYIETLKAIVSTLAKKTRPNDKINLIIGAITSPADVRYLRQVSEDMAFSGILLPDTSETFDAPLVENMPRIPSGGTPIEDIRDMANSRGTVTLGALSRKDAGKYLEKHFAVPHTRLPLPVGLEYTDMFFAELERVSGTVLPGKYELERGRLLDAMIDVHKYVAHVRTAVFGDTEIVLGITKFLTELGMEPAVITAGANNPGFVEYARKLAPDAVIRCGVDFKGIHSEIKTGEIELMIGPFTGRQISRTEKIPLLRVGFPVHDRVGAARQLILGYEGAMRLSDAITNTILEHK